MLTEATDGGGESVLPTTPSADPQAVNATAMAISTRLRRGILFGKTNERAPLKLPMVSPGQLGSFKKRVVVRIFAEQDEASVACWPIRMC